MTAVLNKTEIEINGDILVNSAVYTIYSGSGLL